MVRRQCTACFFMPFTADPRSMVRQWSRESLAPEHPMHRAKEMAHTDRFWQDFHRIEAGTRMKRLVLTRFPRHYNHFRRRKILTKYGDDLQPFALWHVESMVQNEATDLQESAGPEKPVSKLATGVASLPSSPVFPSTRRWATLCQSPPAGRRRSRYHSTGMAGTHAYSQSGSSL